MIEGFTDSLEDMDGEDIMEVIAQLLCKAATKSRQNRENDDFIKCETSDFETSDGERNMYNRFSSVSIIGFTCLSSSLLTLSVINGKAHPHSFHNAWGAVASKTVFDKAKMTNNGPESPPAAILTQEKTTTLRTKRKTAHSQACIRHSTATVAPSIHTHHCQQKYTEKMVTTRSGKAKAAPKSPAKKAAKAKAPAPEVKAAVKKTKKPAAAAPAPPPGPTARTPPSRPKRTPRPPGRPAKKATGKEPKSASPSDSDAGIDDYVEKAKQASPSKKGKKGKKPAKASAAPQRPARANAAAQDDSPLARRGRRSNANYQPRVEDEPESPVFYTPARAAAAAGVDDNGPPSDFSPIEAGRPNSRRGRGGSVPPPPNFGGPVNGRRGARGPQYSIPSTPDVPVYGPGAAPLAAYPFEGPRDMLRAREGTRQAARNGFVRQEAHNASPDPFVGPRRPARRRTRRRSSTPLEDNPAAVYAPGPVRPPGRRHPTISQPREIRGSLRPLLTPRQFARELRRLQDRLVTDPDHVNRLRHVRAARRAQRAISEFDRAVEGERRRRREATPDGEVGLGISGL